MVTGHSLGGGVAAIMGCLLRPAFPELSVWALAPPGGLMSPEVSCYCQRRSRLDMQVQLEAWHSCTCDNGRCSKLRSLQLEVI